MHFRLIHQSIKHKIAIERGGVVVMAMAMESA